MTCRDFAGFLLKYLDDELPDATRRQFETHLAECPDCVAYLRQYRDTIRLVATAGDDEVLAPMPAQLAHALVAAARIAAR